MSSISSFPTFSINLLQRLLISDYSSFLGLSASLIRLLTFFMVSIVLHILVWKSVMARLKFCVVVWLLITAATELLLLPPVDRSAFESTCPENQLHPKAWAHVILFFTSRSNIDAIKVLTSSLTGNEWTLGSSVRMLLKSVLLSLPLNGKLPVNTT